MSTIIIDTAHQDHEIVLDFCKYLDYTFSAASRISLQKILSYKIITPASCEFYPILSINEYSKRNRFSILVSTIYENKNLEEITHESSTLFVWTDKIASVLDRLNLSAVLKERLKEYIEVLMKNGMRLNFYFKRELNNYETSQFMEKLMNIKAKFNEKEVSNELEAFYDEWENNLDYIVGAALSNPIRKLLSASLNELEEAQMKIFLLSKDSEERTLPTAYKTRLLTDVTDIKRLIANDYETLFILIKYILNSLKKSQSQFLPNSQPKQKIRMNRIEKSQRLILIINGESFDIIQTNAYLLNHFLFLIVACDGLIAFEMSSIQREKLLFLVQNLLNECTNEKVLFIGHSAGDQKLFQLANAAIEIIDFENDEPKPIEKRLINNISELNKFGPRGISSDDSSLFIRKPTLGKNAPINSIFDLSSAQPSFFASGFTNKPKFVEKVFNITGKNSLNNLLFLQDPPDFPIQKKKKIVKIFNGQCQADVVVSSVINIAELITVWSRMAKEEVEKVIYGMIYVVAFLMVMRFILEFSSYFSNANIIDDFFVIMFIKNVFFLLISHCIYYENNKKIFTWKMFPILFRRSEWKKNFEFAKLLVRSIFPALLSSLILHFFVICQENDVSTLTVSEYCAETYLLLFIVSYIKVYLEIKNIPITYIYSVLFMLLLILLDLYFLRSEDIFADNYLYIIWCCDPVNLLLKLGIILFFTGFINSLLNYIWKFINSRKSLKSLLNMENNHEQVSPLKRKLVEKYEIMTLESKLYLHYNFLFFFIFNKGKKNGASVSKFLKKRKWIQ